MSFGPDPWAQRHWDARAATNFMCGGAGAGLIVFTAFGAAPRAAYGVGLAFIALGLFAVWLELGRPWRSANVVRNPKTSWMAREALVAPVLVAATLAAAFGLPGAAPLAALLALAFAYCQARMVQAAKGIPAWREALTVPLLVVTGLAEGAGLALLLGAFSSPAPASPWLAGAALWFVRPLLWNAWRRRLRAAPRALDAIDGAGHVLKAGSWLPLALAVVALLAPLGPLNLALLQAAAGALALAGGLWFKFVLITRGAYNQGFALAHLPVRGVRRAGGG